MKQIDIPIIRSSRRKTLAIQVERDGHITVRAPERLSDRVIATFIKREQAWIEKQLSSQKRKKPAPEKTFSQGEVFFYLGEKIELEFVENGRQSLCLDGTFKLKTRAQPRARNLFTRWYKKEAREMIHARVAERAVDMKLDYGRIRISSAKYTWGSCSPKNDLSFTWRLAMTPHEVLDYIVVHELSHIRHKNHGKRFWQHVERYCPEHKKLRAWLEEYNHLLQL